MVSDCKNEPRFVSLYGPGSWILLFLSLLTLWACGGSASGSGGGGSSSQTPSFTLAVSPKTQTIAAGKQGTVSLSATPTGEFSGEISVLITGVPAGVALSPTTITLKPGMSQQVTLSVATNAASASQQITFTGSAGSLSQTAQLSLTINGLSAPPAGRTKYLRTDATTEYFSDVNSHWIIFNPPTSRFFVTDPDSNHIFVFDSVSETEVGVISVPGAFGIGDSPDHTTLYAGTLIGDVYTIDPVGMTVTARYLASQIGPDGFSGSIALGLSNGSVALLGAPGGIPSIDGAPAFAVWNPTTNGISVYTSAYGAGETKPPYTVVCGPLGLISGFTLTADRAQVIIGSGDSDGTLCEVNATSGADIYGTGPAFGLNNIITSPDGNYIALPDYPGNVEIFNAQTLNPVITFGVAGEVDAASGFAVSADSSTLFVPDDSSDNVIYAYNLLSGQQVGWLPGLYVDTTGGGSASGPSNAPFLLAVDGTGLFAGPLEEGIGFVDSATMRTGTVGTKFSSGSLDPATGPPSGGTQTQWAAPDPMGELAGVYFGGLPAVDAAVSQNAQSQEQIVASSPSGSPGAVDVYAFTADGGMQLIPEGFSYGPTILQVTPDMATLEGGGTGIVYGYGFGPLGSSSNPSGLQVTVGGKTAQVAGYNSDPYNLIIPPPPPFPLEAVTYLVPPGTLGTGNVTVSTAAGQATASGSLTYLPAIQQFPLSGAVLAQGIYDPHRDLYYFTDTNKIQIFSRTQGAWLSPVSIPGPPGMTQRLWGLGLSPDGDNLAIADASAQVIYFLDPSTWSSVQTFSVPTVPPSSGILTNAAGVAVSDSGIIYYAAWINGGDGYEQFFQLDTSTGVVTGYQYLDGPGEGQSDMYLRTEISSDNSQVFFNMLGEVFSINTATNDITHATVEPGCCYGDYELALSADQTQLEASSYFYDLNLNAESYSSMNDREGMDIEYVYGSKFNPDGTLLFQPSTNGIDVFDGRLGILLHRISLPFSLSYNYDALVIDGTDSVLIAITGSGNGIAIVDLTSIQEPPPLPYAKSKHRTPALYKGLPLDWNNQRQTNDRTRHLQLPARRVPHVTRSTSPTPVTGRSANRERTR